MASKKTPRTPKAVSLNVKSETLQNMNKYRVKGSSDSRTQCSDGWEYMAMEAQIIKKFRSKSGWCKITGDAHSSPTSRQLQFVKDKLEQTGIWLRTARWPGNKRVPLGSSIRYLDPKIFRFTSQPMHVNSLSKNKQLQRGNDKYTMEQTKFFLT